MKLLAKMQTVKTWLAKKWQQLKAWGIKTKNKIINIFTKK